MISSKSKISSSNGTTPKPNTVAYNSVLDAPLRDRVILLVRTKYFAMMEDDDFSRSGNSVNVKSDVTTYNTVLNALSKSNDEQEDGAIIITAAVEKLLTQIMNTHYKDGTLEVGGGANDVTYTTMISCFEKFEGTEKRIQELKLLKDRMKRNHVKKVLHCNFK